MKKLFLGIDTSNYTTSIAVLDEENNILCDFRNPLEVPTAKRGLRQSEAFFQHSKNLPVIYEKLVKQVDISKIKACSVSVAPRRLEGSYMPVFLAGENFGRIVSNSLDIPLFKFSHQEGHIKSALIDIDCEVEKFFCFHLSGGTSELMKIEKNKNFITDQIPYICERIGGSLDISFGQLIDRIGVALGMNFPAGLEMDKIANTCDVIGKKLKSRIYSKKIDAKLGYVNLSGIETKLTQFINSFYMEDNLNKFDDAKKYDILNCYDSATNLVAHNLFILIDQAITNIFNSLNIGKLDDIMLVGGVSESKFLQRKLTAKFPNIKFGKNGRDNGIGIAALGGELWRLNQ